MGETEKKYVHAGRIAAEVKAEVLQKTEPGMRILEIAELIEQRVAEKNGSLAFPPNISINDMAAHYTPCHNDAKVIAENDLVKIDIGVHVDGYVGDLAFTYCSQTNELVKAAEQALQEAIKVIRPGVTVAEIGATIENFVHNSGFGLVTNLTGHGLERFSLHHEPSIPNVRNQNQHAFQAGDAIAIEPFVMASDGYVKDTGLVEIYQYHADRPVRLAEARAILALVRDDYHGLPFAKRWLHAKFTAPKIALALRQLESVGAIESHPVLRATDGKPIAQAEHTVLVADRPIITTSL
ncbi:MAG: type II methionyl aminopeptidase [Candidatus Aenigmarchaeota archaeon]|nr:type II methionyl aminopeptidase [Candidatus Aenigmarchaeota archaeon]